MSKSLCSVRDKISIATTIILLHTTQSLGFTVPSAARLGIDPSTRKLRPTSAPACPWVSLLITFPMPRCRTPRAAHWAWSWYLHRGAQAEGRTTACMLHLGARHRSVSAARQGGPEGISPRLWSPISARAQAIVCGGSSDPKNNSEAASASSSGEAEDSGTTPRREDESSSDFAGVEPDASGNPPLPPSRPALLVTRSGPERDQGYADPSESTWFPRLLPPPLDDRDEEKTSFRPLIELPLDGVLLQLFPALLIGVVGLILTVAVQVEAGRFDGMVAGEDGGEMVITDLRETRKTEP